MSNSHILIVKFEPPGSMTLERQETEAVGVHGHPDWLGLPDALFDEDTMALIGLVFPIVGGDETIRRIEASFDVSKYVRVVDATDIASRNLYFGDDEERWLEIKWAKASRVGYVPAQIADVNFDFASDDVTDQMPTQMELWNCFDVADELGLKMLAVE